MDSNAIVRRVRGRVLSGHVDPVFVAISVDADEMPPDGVEVTIEWRDASAVDKTMRDLGFLWDNEQEAWFCRATMLEIPGWLAGNFDDLGVLKEAIAIARRERAREGGRGE